MDACLSNTQYDIPAIEGTIDPSLLLELPPYNALLAWPKDLQYVDDPGVPYLGLEDNGSDALVDTFNGDAISSQVPLLQPERSSNNEALPSNAHGYGYPENQTSTFFTSPEMKVSQTSESGHTFSTVVETAKRFKNKLWTDFPPSGCFDNGDAPTLARMMYYLCDLILTSESQRIASENFTAERESKNGQKRVRNQTATSEADHSTNSWTGAESTLILKYSMLIESRLSNCRNSSILITRLSKRERRTLRATAHLKQINHLSFGQGAARCLLLSKHGILDQGRLTRTGCTFVGKNNRDWIDVSTVELVACHKSCMSCSRNSLCKDTPHRGCDPIGVEDSKQLLKTAGLDTQTSPSHPDEIARMCFILHGQPRFLISDSNRSFEQRIVNICFPSVTMAQYPSPPQPSRQKSVKTKSSKRPTDVRHTDPSLPLVPKAQPQSENSWQSSITATYAQYTDSDFSMFRFVQSPRDRLGQSSFNAKSFESEIYAHHPDSSFNHSSDSTGSARKRHKRMPRVEEGYECEHCKKLFSTNGERSKHAKIHQPAFSRPHGCPKCDKRFMDRKDLERHLKTPHGLSTNVSLASSGSELDVQPESRSGRL